MQSAMAAGAASPSTATPRRRWETAYPWLLAGLLAVGLLVRVELTYHSPGNPYDLRSLQLVGQILPHSISGVYTPSSYPLGKLRWPYLTGYFPVIWFVHVISSAAQFTRWIRVPPSMADLALAWVVQDHLRFRGASHAQRFAGAALVAVGPSFVAISGVHGQLDAVAILPAAVALTVWDREVDHRALIAGLLIGLGADIKTVPGLMLFALLPTSRSRREAATLTAAVCVIPVLASLPVVIGSGTSWIHVVSGYHGVIGLGGISLLLDPKLALIWFGARHGTVNGADLWLYDHGSLLSIIPILICAAGLLYRRVPAERGAVMIWLTIYVFSSGFFMEYMVWGLPFMLMSRYLWRTAFLQAVLFLPVLITYHGVRHAWILDVFYILPMAFAWLLEVGALAVLARGVAQRSERLGFRRRTAPIT